MAEVILLEGRFFSPFFFIRSSQNFADYKQEKFFFMGQSNIAFEINLQSHNLFKSALSLPLLRFFLWEVIAAPLFILIFNI